MANTLALLQHEGDPVALLARLTGWTIYPRSLVSDRNSLFFLGREGTTKRLGLLSAGDEPGFDLALRSVTVAGQSLRLGQGATDHANALALRARLPFAAPVPVGVRLSAGLGDRLGIATPGHLRALRHFPGIFPILAQQSIREMERTARTPEQVLDDATWGVFQEGWRTGYGADADHLKTTADIDACLAAGFVLFTFDPREHVDNVAETDSLEELQRKFAALPWRGLSSDPAATRQTYLNRTWTLPGTTVALNEEQLLRAACKYGRALAHLALLYRHLQQRAVARPYELEISVDETDTPTRPEEHFYIASELKRLGVSWVSLAPRYVGRFEKGVDYIGDLSVFEGEFRRHVAIARALGPYKLSLHSGSDKFSIYPIVARLAQGLVHLKTAGTWYLEALRAVSRLDPALFREILGFAIAHYSQDRASYYVSGELNKIPAPASLSDDELPGVLEQFDARQALHVTFGTVLTARDAQGRPLFHDRLFAALEGDEEAHYAALEAYVSKHLQPFSA